MAWLDFLQDYTECTQIWYDKELWGLMFQLYSKRQWQMTNIRVECKKKEVTKKFVEDNLAKLREMIETDIKN